MLMSTLVKEPEVLSNVASSQSVNPIHFNYSLRVLMHPPTLAHSLTHTLSLSLSLSLARAVLVALGQANHHQVVEFAKRTLLIRFESRMISVVGRSECVYRSKRKRNSIK